MGQFPELSDEPLWSLFRDFSAPGPPSEIPESERSAWYCEAAVRIAKAGKHGLEFLLSHLSQVDEPRIRAILTSLAFLDRRLVNQPKPRDQIRDSLLSLFGHHDPLVLADAIDALRLLDFREALPRVLRLQGDPSPYIVGSVLRFLRQHDPARARPILEEALKSPEPIVRENGVDELDELHSVESLPKLRELLSDPDADVRQAVETAVAHLEGMQQAERIGGE